MLPNIFLIFSNKGIEAVSAVILKPVFISPLSEKETQNEPSPSIIPAKLSFVIGVSIVLNLFSIKDNDSP